MLNFKLNSVCQLFLNKTGKKKKERERNLRAGTVFYLEIQTLS